MPPARKPKLVGTVAAAMVTGNDSDAVGRTHGVRTKHINGRRIPVQAAQRPPVVVAVS